MSHPVFHDWRQDPNLLSHWYPKIKACGFNVPKTTILQLPDDIIKASFAESKEDIEKLRTYIRETLLPAIKKHGTDVFLKNGCFSNKFNFRSCHPADLSEETLLRSIMDITEMAACHDAMGHTELVIRDFIPAAEHTPTIYNGMPLRTEYRLFYDFDNHRVLYAVNYWDAGYCRNHIPEKDTEAFDKATPLILAQYRSTIPMVMSLAHQQLRNVEGLTGVWSVDLLLDEQHTLWLIDMAVGRRSAYWDPTKALLCSFEKEYWNVLRGLDPQKTDALQLNAPLGEHAATTAPVHELWRKRRLPFLLELSGIDRKELLGRYLTEEYAPFVQEYHRIKEKDNDDPRLLAISTILEMAAAKEYCRRFLYTYEGLHDYLRNKDAHFDDIHMFPGSTVTIPVSWGDWKHSHAYLDYLMTNIGYTQAADTLVTEENGSDCYSAEHYYTPNLN